jgi:putative membrane protein
MSDTSIGAENILHGALAGIIGGAVASWVMNKYMEAQQQQTAEQSQNRSSQKSQKSQKKSEQSSSQEGGDATVKTAQAISRNLFDHELTASEKKIAGPAVHYGYGSLVGGLYGALAESSPLFTTGFGMVYGIALWALGDEVAVPALRLGPPPTQVPPRKHADYLGAHLIYGIALDVTRRAFRHIV